MPARVVPSQPAPGENWYQDDPTLRALLALHVPADRLKAAEARLHDLGRAAPSQIDPMARLADKHRPILHPRTPEGERVDDVEFHPAYHELQRLAREHEVFTLAWRGEPRTLAFALGYLYGQAECGYYCPACMTDGAAYVLDRHAPAAIKNAYVPKLVQRSPIGAYEGAMYLTEKGGGSDVGGGTATTARPHPDGTWRLTGEKWFASNCVADCALALARMPANESGTRGLGLFLIPRHLPDGTRNPGVRIERLKNKLGVTSMPTGEILLQDAHAYLIAPERQGFKAMAEMVNLSRLYNAVASVALARRALRESQRAGEHRESFGKPLREHPLYLRGLVALTVDIEAALALTLETAALFDKHAQGDDHAGRVLRVMTPCAKAMTAKLAVHAASQACEMLGGCGYIEDYVTPRLLRDAQVLPIWEGTTNVQALELQKTCERPENLEAFATYTHALLATTPANPARDAATRAIETLTREPPTEMSALRALATTYHATATTLLQRIPGDRARTIAHLYAARHLNPDGERALDETTTREGARIAYPSG